MSDQISPIELEALLQSDSVTLLDVRRANDRESNPNAIQGATWQAPENVAAWAKAIPADKPVVIYCARGGSVSVSVHAALQEEGFNVQFVEGGLAAWEEHLAKR
ncbi:rhodanese-like domain-containing protein [Desulfovibrio subterraneus]|uniref:Sulfurtransferase n=1 Tax=Desulfovibrio subterraneus TaxID=2718620 RepID=A0A7J0BG21_9BACT|nr:rhodanese-like domain-containing protein [Desulfovibrio subterraneus]GFM32055.1 sulfurtransferase [Desulfovibrio subterraneus]